MKKLLALFLAAVLCFSVLPFSAFAEDVTEESAPAEEIAEEIPAPAAEAEAPAEKAEEIVSAPAEEETSEPAEESAEEEGELELLAEDPNASILTAKNFPDANLLAALTALFPEGLTAQEAAETVKLWDWGQTVPNNIKDCTGINKFFPNLENLYFEGNPIKKLDISGMSKIQELGLNDCTDLTTLILPNPEGAALIDILVCNTALTSLDLSGFENLETVRCYDCPYLSTVKFAGCTGLLEVSANYSGLASLDLSGASNLEYLNVEGTNLTELDVSGLENLDELICGNSRIRSLNCENCYNLEVLDAECARIEELNLNNSELYELNLNYNCLSYYDFSDLEDLDADDIVAYYQTTTRPVNGVRFGDYVYLNLLKDGIVPEYADVYFTLGAYWEGYGEAIIPTDSINMMSGQYYIDFEVEWPVAHGWGPYVNVSVPLNIVDARINVPEYILLDGTKTDGEEVKIIWFDGRVMDDDAAYYGGLRISVSDPVGFPCVSVENNVIKPVSVGSAVLQYTIFAYDYDIEHEFEVQRGDIRVDVTAGAISDEETGVLGASLKQTAATVELFKTDYTELDVVLHLEQNQFLMGLDEPSELTAVPDRGYAVESAKFTGAAADWYNLAVKDDRTLQIVPVYEKMAAVYAKTAKAPGALTAQVEITLAGGKTFTTENAVKITAKTTQPTVSVKAITLNSWPGFDGDETSVGLSWTAKNAPAVNGFSVASAPEWVAFEANDYGNVAVYSGAGKAKLSGTARLEFDVEGYAVKPEANVKITAKPTAPKYYCSVKTISLQANTTDCAYISLEAILPVAAGKNTGYADDFNILRATEGSGKTMRTFTPSGSVNRPDVSYTLDGETLYVKDFGLFFGCERKLKVSLLNPDGLKHTYKLYFNYGGAERSITVNVYPESTVPSFVIKPSKYSEPLDISLPYAQKIELELTGKYCGTNSEYINTWNPDTAFTVLDVQKQDVTSHFTMDYNEYALLLNLTDKTGLNPGKYTLRFGADIFGTESEENYVWGSCSFTVKKSKLPEPSMKLSVKGSLEAYRSAILTVTCTEIYCGVMDASSLHIYSDKACTNDVTASFHVFDGWINMPSFEKATRGDNIEATAATQPGTYYVRMEGGERLGGGEPVNSNVAKLTVKGTVPKVKQEVKEITLSSRDCNDYAAVKLWPDGANTPVCKVEPDAASAKWFDAVVSRFAANDKGETEILVGWGDADAAGFTVLKPGTVKTVKLNVFFDGHGGTCKPATVTLKVRIK